MYGACLKPPNVCILYEYVSGGSLHDRIYADPPLTYLEVLCLARDIAEGLVRAVP
jgi:serine/threonine protein kinase